MVAKAPMPAESAQEEPLVKPEDLFEPLAKLNKFRKYWQTRKAILTGIPVYDMSKDEREKEGYLGAWAFNAAQSSLSAVPALAVGAVRGILGLKDADEGFVLRQFGAVWAVCLPFVLMFVAYTVGRLSLWKSDGTKSSKVRAARIYLYLDGSYGLFPQLAWSIVLIPQVFGLVVFDVKAVIQWIGIWQFIISMKQIPEDLFPALGYWGGRRNVLVHGTRMPSLFSSALENEDAQRVSKIEPPVWRYRISVLVLAPLIAIGIAAVVLICTSLVAVILHKT